MGRIGIEEFMEAIGTIGIELMEGKRIEYMEGIVIKFVEGIRINY